MPESIPVSTAPPPAYSFTVVPERPADAVLIEDLHERAFGPGRFARAAFRLRESGSGHDPDLSLVALHAGRLVGTVRLTAITIAGRPALLLGPLAVEPEWKGRGAGKLLVRSSLDAARARGHRIVLLVGDEPYYGPLGFERLAPYAVTLPGPADPTRVLLAGLVPGALVGLAGPAEPARATQP